MITRSLLIVFFLIMNSFLSWAQTTKNSAVSVKEFTDNPFPFEMNLEQLEKYYGDYLKKEKYTKKNRFAPTQKDTIVRFFKGKTEFFFYQPYNGKPLFVAANIFDKRIKIKGDIATTMTSRELFNKITYPDTGSDTIKISLPEGAYKVSMVLKDEKIYHIKIEARNNYH